MRERGGVRGSERVRSDTQVSVYFKFRLLYTAHLYSKIIVVSSFLKHFIHINYLPSKISPCIVDRRKM